MHDYLRSRNRRGIGQNLKESGGVEWEDPTPPHYAGLASNVSTLAGVMPPSRDEGIPVGRGVCVLAVQNAAGLNGRIRPFGCGARGLLHPASSPPR